MIAAGVTETDMTDEPKNENDQYDIRDETMDIDDAVSSGAGIEPLETSPDPDASNWQTELVRQAKEKGLPESVIDKISNASAVDDLLSIIANGIQKSQASEAPEVRYEPKKSEDFVLDIDESTAFDPDSARALKAMNDFYSNRLRELESKIADRKDAESIGEVQSYVKKLGSEWGGVFGTSEKPNMDNIKKLEESVQTIRAGYAARHKRIPAEQDLYKMALNASFGDRQGEIARNQLNDKVAKRAGQIVNRPGTRTAASANPRMRAAQGVADWFRAKGIDPFGSANDSFQ
jgi:hypothetical protein